MPPLDTYEFYTRLEANHAVEVDEGGYQIVLCPFTNPLDGLPFRTSWAPTANPEEIDCLFCEHLNDGPAAFDGCDGEHD